MENSQEYLNIGVLLTCHNRREKTLSCLDFLFAQNIPQNVKFEVLLSDDGSSDNTAETVREVFSTVNVLSGDGSLFWNGGMRLAFSKALGMDFDFFLWLNDDTQLYPQALRLLLDTHSNIHAATGDELIVVGTTCSPEGDPTYGGVIRLSRLRRTTFNLVKPGVVPIKCETMNGNCVLIPRKIAEKLGNLDADFTHGMGDFDYGLRARAAGFSIWVMPGYAGVCAKNTPAGTFNDRSLSLAERWRRMRSPKGLPPGEWRLFCRRHAGPVWWLYYLWPYVRLLFSSFRTATQLKRVDHGKPKSTV